MANIIYTYKNQAYGNITNECDCACTFCIRGQQDTIGEAESMWHTTPPTLEDIKKAMDDFDFTNYDEFVYCGYGEPTCALDNLLASARYLKDTHPNIRIRLNTNGLGNLYHKRDIIPELAEVIDSVSISLNAPDEDTYNKVTRPQFEHAYPAMLDFAEECNKMIAHTQLSIVDVLPEDEIQRCQEIADSRGVYLKIRKFS